MSGRTALILGATGATGKSLLKELLASKEFERVHEIGRRVTPLDQLEFGKEKLTQQAVDFEKIEAEGLGASRWDAVFITLGTTRRAAGSAAAFEKIDREYVVNAAKAVKSNDPKFSQRLVYLSSAGASATSPFLYPKSKGLTEIALAKLDYSDTIVFRPGLLKYRGEKEKWVEKAAGWFTTIATHFGNDYEIPIPVLAKAITRAGEVGTGSLPQDAAPQVTEVGDGAKFTLITNRGANNLGHWDP